MWTSPDVVSSCVELKPENFQEHRRSTRVPLEVSIEVDSDPSHPVVRGATVVVNLHGALIRTEAPLQPASSIKVTVYLTSKSAQARVVYASPANPLEYGIELNQPQNIWGVSLPPEDWEDEVR